MVGIMMIMNSMNEKLNAIVIMMVTIMTGIMKFVCSVKTGWLGLRDVALGYAVKQWQAMASNGKRCKRLTFNN